MSSRPFQSPSMSLLDRLQNASDRPNDTPQQLNNLPHKRPDHPRPSLISRLTDPVTLANTPRILSSSESSVNGNPTKPLLARLSSKGQTSSNNSSLSPNMTEPFCSPISSTKLKRKRSQTISPDLTKQSSKLCKMSLQERISSPTTDITKTLIQRLDLARNGVEILNPTTEKGRERSRKSEKKTSLGSKHLDVTPKRNSHLACGKPERSSKMHDRMSEKSHTGLNKLLEHPLISPQPSGQISYTADPSTLTTSTQTHTYRSLCERMWNAWEMSRSSFPMSTNLSLSKQPATGLQPGVGPPKQLQLSSHIDSGSWTNTRNISRTFSEPRSRPHMTASSSTIKPSERRSEVDNPPPLSTNTSTVTYTPLSCCQEGLSTNPALPAPRDDPDLMSVDASTAKKGAEVPQIVGTNMSVDSAVIPDMVERLVLKENQLTRIKPKYLRFNCWNISGEPAPTVVDWSNNFGVAKAIPSAPYLEPNHPVRITVDSHPELFKIVTPIKHEVLREYLNIHPNFELVDSVCDGLEQGFWPWADINKDNFPTINDESRPTPIDPIKAQFLRDQRDEEIMKGRFSRAFGRDLLPGMYAMPSFAVPKLNSTKLRLVTDQSSGPFSVNAFTEPHKKSFPLDNMVQLGEILMRAHKNLPEGKHLVLFKSDVSEAYRLLPMHPYWQVKQINTIDGKRYVDRNNAFGGRRSGDLFIAFMSLVLWIAKQEYKLDDLCSYVDDVFSISVSDDTDLYEPYDMVLPRKQAQLLRLWDELGIPHKKEKQVWGSRLTIIGFEVDAINLTITLPTQKKTELLEELDRFIVPKDDKRRKQFTLWEFQCLAGWMNWGFNVFPLIRPALNNLYAKTGHKNRKQGKVHMNKAVSKDLEWGRNHIKALNGVIILKELDWTLGNSDLSIFCDASLAGLGFWVEKTNQGFYAKVPKEIPDNMNFLREAFCVASALNEFAPKLKNCRLVVYTDNQNTVDIYSSLSCRPEYNDVLKFSVDLFIAHNLQFKVVHIAGELNRIADALSRNQIPLVRQLSPGIIIKSFLPPLDALGELKK